jgi:hypothetical protein
MKGYVIVGLQRKFWTGEKINRHPNHNNLWDCDLSEAMVYNSIADAVNVSEGLSEKSFVVESYGGYNEKLMFKNFNYGREIIWGRRFVANDRTIGTALEVNTGEAETQDSTDKA